MKVTLSPVSGPAGEMSKDALGAARIVTSTSASSVFGDGSPVSETRSPTVNVPGEKYWVETKDSVPVSVSKLPLPSRSHSYLVIVPSKSDDPEPSKMTSSPVVAGFGVASIEASGGSRSSGSALAPGASASEHAATTVASTAKRVRPRRGRPWPPIADLAIKLTPFGFPAFPATSMSPDPCSANCKGSPPV